MALRNIQLIIYGLDGTLVDSFRDIHACVSEAMVQCGLAPPPFVIVKSHVGDGARALIRRCLGPQHADRFDAVYPAYREIYRAHPTRYARLYPGVMETLRTFRERGLRQAILTNKPDDATQVACRELGLTPLMEVVQGECEGRPRKPDPESLRAVARRIGVDPARCLMVGDGPADYDVARAAGAPMAGVTYGFLTREATLARQPDWVLDRFDALLDGVGTEGLAEQ